MARRKVSIVKKVVIVGGALILLQIVFLAIFGRQRQPGGFKEALHEAVISKGNISPERRAKVKLQVALSDYRAKNKKYPSTLKELVPDYFESVPIDPETGSPFQYSLVKDHYVLGDPQKVASTGKTPAAAPADEQTALIATLDEPAEANNFVYDSTGKRDPFRSFDFSPKEAGTAGDSVLERYSYDELKFAAVLKGIGTPKAVVEDPSGKGHTVEIGTSLGIYGGKVMKIEDDRIVILETIIEFTGEERTRTVEMYLHRGAGKK
jgi:Tfp pilus assembly protein PilP